MKKEQKESFIKSTAYLLNKNIDEINKQFTSDNHYSDLFRYLYKNDYNFIMNPLTVFTKKKLTVNKLAKLLQPLNTKYAVVLEDGIMTVIENGKCIDNNYSKKYADIIFKDISDIFNNKMMDVLLSA
jgi:hypothetical protein